jgi:hypothetical protein
MMTSRNRTNRRWVALVALIPLLGCAAEPASEEPSAPVPVEAESLAVPFTAEQIRDEWTPGFTLVLSFNFPDRQEWQRWTVVGADTERAEIEYQQLDDQGQPVAPPQRAPSSWTDLRNHALFAAAESRRERVSRQTVLGELEGWLYTVHDPQAETMTEFFFADELPGAPVWMQTRSGEEVILTVNQVARQHLAGPPAVDPETAPEQG